MPAVEQAGDTLEWVVLVIRTKRQAEGRIFSGICGGMMAKLFTGCGDRKSEVIPGASRSCDGVKVATSWVRGTRVSHRWEPWESKTLGSPENRALGRTVSRKRYSSWQAKILRCFVSRLVGGCLRALRAVSVAVRARARRQVDPDERGVCIMICRYDDPPPHHPIGIQGSIVGGPVSLVSDDRLDSGHLVARELRTGCSLEETRKNAQERSWRLSGLQILKRTVEWTYLILIR